MNLVYISFCSESLFEQILYLFYLYFFLVRETFFILLPKDNKDGCGLWDSGRHSNGDHLIELHRA